MQTPVSITAPALHQRLEAGEAIQLVDVREAAELELARLSQPVIHLPLSQSEQWLGQLEQLLERDRPVAVLCHAGIRSWQFACWLMQERQYPQVWNLVGGIEAWSALVDPTVPRY
ncbi:rhodanese domain protein [Cyanobium sp. PCC 7001]|uniref:rhodanese-like domain-containing protein n=1 Tax=Cyanobium sp. PCC 7001 TaxID=180281 RepID=UPI0001805D69|nr:rhodanese-like domain-containing protein [Cyanobium sp. PCC 7001]EDY39409.1 rhodanese domain protein [Cyanobium sp. PCC 7001]